MKECDGCFLTIKPALVDCLIRSQYPEGIENCPCQNCIVKINCSIYCEERSSWSWFVINHPSQRSSYLWEETK
jgi:hypothetical protein